MKNISTILLLLLLSIFLACEETSTTTGGNETNEIAEIPQDTSNENPETSGDSREKTNLKDCPISGKVKGKNSFRMDDLAQMISISADESTHDADLGDSHRVLEVFNTNDCSSILKETLPVNRSADFPYYLAANCFEQNNKIVAIQGYTNFYYYNAENQKLSKPLEPDFLTEKGMVDAQSGMIRGLMVWRHYILGHSIDNGPFAFDISDKANPKPVLPIAEYAVPKTAEFRYLFILDAGNDRFQAILPSTDIDAGGNTFKPRKMFDQALKIETTIPKSARNNRFIILKDNTDPNQEKRVVVDMFGQKGVPLPAEIASKKTTDILNWLRSQ